MSAWIVSRKHINILVAGITENELADTTRSSLGRMLWAENLASVAHRYPDDTDGTRPGPNNFHDADVETYVYRAPNISHRTPGTYLKLAESYRYQSCEHPGWESSDAQKVVAALIDKLMADGVNLTDEYKNAPWSI